MYFCTHKRRENMALNQNTETLVKEKTFSLEEILTLNKLIVHNDEVNTFDWVIETLIQVCKHSSEQAEQCSLIIHHKGKAQVKHGSMDELKPLKDAICDRGIGATIE